MSCYPISNVSPSPQRNRAEAGFSLVELLVVIAIIAILASLILPALGKAKSQAQGMQCLSNTRQLTLGWLMYADDHDGWLCPNGGAFKQGWVSGTLNFDSNFEANTNLVYLLDPEHAKLAPYVPAANVYMCPADRSMVRMGKRLLPRVRTLAMNDAVGSNAEGLSLPPSAGWRVYRKINQLTAPSPSQLWLIMEQHPDSINDGRFAVDCQNQGTAARLVDFPANFHNNSCSISFADGHSEAHRWMDAPTLQPNKYCGCLSHYAAQGLFVSSPNGRDMAWIQARTSAKK